MADYTPAQAAEKLPISESWLRKEISRLPHLRFGNKIFFTDAHLEQIRAMHEHQPQAPAADPSQLRGVTRRRKAVS